MATIKRMISAKTDGNGKSEILLRFTIGRGMQLRLKTTLFIPPDRFVDGSIVRPRVSSSQYQEIRDIEKQLLGLEQMLYDVCQEHAGEVLSKEYLQEQIERFLHPVIETEDTVTEEDNDPVPFFDAFDDFVRVRRISDWRKQRYMVLKRALQRFEAYRKIKRVRKYKLSLTTFCYDDVIQFESFLRNEPEIFDKYPKIFEKYPSDTRKSHKTRRPLPKGDNTIINIFSCLRSFFKECRERGFMNSQPFERYKGMTVEQYGTPYYITLEERDKIADHDYSSSPALALQRDIFIFHTLIGCRVSDLYRLTPNNIINGAIEYIASKTLRDRAKVIRVPLNQRGLDILERYKGQDPEGRIFPFITQQKYNIAIKRIFKDCGITRMVTILNALTGKEEQRPINELASSHLARRTFVGNLYKKVKDPNLVGALSGHKEGSRAFARYREIDEDMKKELISYLD